MRVERSVETSGHSESSPNITLGDLIGTEKDFSYAELQSLRHELQQDQELMRDTIRYFIRKDS